MERPINVLHLNTWPTGGAGEACKRINKALVKRGVNSKILFLDCDETTDGGYSYAKLESKWAYKFKILVLKALSFLPTIGKPKTYINSLYSPFDVTRHKLFQEADIIHVHWVCKFVNWKKVLSQGKPIVLTMHDMYPFTGSYHFKTGVDFEKYSQLIKKRKSRIKDYYTHTNVFPSAPSHWLTRVANESEVFNNEVLCIPNCIDIDIFKKKKDIKINTPKKILFVAENIKDERKGFSILVDALSILPDSLNYELMILGKGDIDLPKSKSLGFITDPKVLVEKYQEADVYVIPSIEDNLPNTVVESLACGTPVVGFNIGGIPDMVTNKKNGFLAENMDAHSLKLEILKAMNTENQLLGTSLLKPVFTQDSVAEKYIKLYKEVLKVAVK